MTNIDQLKLGDIILLSSGQIAKYIGKQRAPGSGTLELNVILSGSPITKRVSTSLYIKKINSVDDDSVNEMWNKTHQRQLKFKKQAHEIIDEL